MKRSEQKPTHVYVARKKCGHIGGAAVDDEDEETIEFVDSLKSRGMTVVRMTLEEYHKMPDRGFSLDSCCKPPDWRSVH